MIEQWEQFWLKKCYGAWWKGSALVVTKPEVFAKDILETYHDSATARHPGMHRTYQQVIKDYWWPDLLRYTREYVRGCGTCQQNKSNTHPKTPSLHPIIPLNESEPFKTIAVDLITKLPISKGSDSVLTITDQGATKAVILLPCNETMGAMELAQLYKERAFPFIGVPSVLVLDRDTRFTSKFFEELCEQLGIKRNMSSAYHPQTDGQSERTNQSVETALRIFANYQQNDWSTWLPVIQYQLNSHVSSTTKVAPFEAWMGYIPRAHQPDRPSRLPAIQQIKEHLREIRENAQEAMMQAQAIWVKPSNH